MGRKDWMKMLDNLRITLNYRGGGLLIASRDGSGRLHVLLGKRCDSPGLGMWSFPGGKCEHLPRKGGKVQVLRFTEDCRAAARREATEEITLWSGALPWPEAGSLVHLWGLRTFFFDWSTYGWMVNNPSLQPATAPGSDRHREFLPIGWFPMDELPKPLHFGVRSAVWRARWKRQAGWNR